MTLENIAEILNGQENLYSIDAATIKNWAEEGGKELAKAKVTRGYFLTIVSQIDRVVNQCKSAKAKGEEANYDSLVFTEPHIGYQASRQKGDAKPALLGLQKLLDNGLRKISTEHLIPDLTRLNQLFQAMAAYFQANRNPESEENDHE